MTGALSNIHMAHTADTPSILLSTDAEKVSDQVDWTFRKVVIQYLNIGSELGLWLEELYSHIVILLFT